MKRMIERFALWLLRKIGYPLEIDIWNVILFYGRWWTVSAWNMRYDCNCDRVNLDITAICVKKDMVP